MKDYRKYAEKIRQMGTFADIHQCGSPTEHSPVDLYFQLCEVYVIGYSFYVSYVGRQWQIHYPDGEPVHRRTDMKTIKGIQTDREMYAEVEKVLSQIRQRCGIGNS